MLDETQPTQPAPEPTTLELLNKLEDEVAAKVTHLQDVNPPLANTQYASQTDFVALQNSFNELVARLKQNSIGNPFPIYAKGEL